MVSTFHRDIIEMEVKVMIGVIEKSLISRVIYTLKKLVDGLLPPPTSWLITTADSYG